MKRLIGVLLLASACLRTGAARDDGRFKMTHRVEASFGSQSMQMSGFLLARPNGDFKVSAQSLTGKKLFDTGRVGGEWKSKVYDAELGQRLNPQHLARAIARIYFTECPANACEVAGDEEVNRVELLRDAKGAVVKKRFFHGQQADVEITYEDWAERKGQWTAGKISLLHPRYTLTIRLEDFDPRPGFADALLEN